MIAPLLIHTEIEGHICIPILHVFLGMVEYALNRLEDMCIDIDKHMYEDGVISDISATVNELISKYKTSVVTVDDTNNRLQTIKHSISILQSLIPQLPHDKADKFSHDLTRIKADHAYYEYLLKEHTKERDGLDKQMRKLTGPFYKRMQQVLFDELKIKKEPYHGGALAGHACDQVC